MFDNDPSPPRLFAVPPGADFPAELLRGLEARMGNARPEEWARVTIYVNTARMRRRLVEGFNAGPPRLLPRIRLLSELASDPLLTDLPPPLPALRRRLDLAHLVRQLIETRAGIAPRAAVFDLADSLASLFDEMAGEGVDPADLDRLDVADRSEHWRNALQFLTIARQVVDTDTLPSAEARLRAAALALADHWEATPPTDPVIVAGSTGSRGPVTLLMQAVARLPQGAVVLPGVDKHMPADVWSILSSDRGMPAEDHPQYRFAALCAAMDLGPSRLPGWTDADPRPARAALISMALRPAPVTDQWRREGPSLGDMHTAVEGLSLIEAVDPAEEAQAIALRLRRAVEDGQTAALVSPDRNLTRRVQAALKRWEITADDSAGTPLHLTPPGRLLRQVAACIGAHPGPESLLALLKHPLVEAPERGPHMLRTRRLDVWLRRHGAPRIDADVLGAFAATQTEGDPEAVGWAARIGGILDTLAACDSRCLGDLATIHVEATQSLSGQDGAVLWDEAEGRAARSVMQRLLTEAREDDEIGAADYARLLDSLLSGEEVRRPDAGRPDVMIWGTLEARVQGAELVILAGLSEGTWPEPPKPDPWLNRDMRRRLGLLLPERRIGLSAHDFQQAAMAPRVVFSRSRRDAEAQTVPSRWLNRLTNLLGGLDGTGGPDALKQMRERGDVWVEQARRVADRTIRADPAPRPSPRPPVEVRPTQLSVTQIEKLVRDPYGIYADKVLRLRPLDPLRPEPDARLRGTLFHAILEDWLNATRDSNGTLEPHVLLDAARPHLARIPWAAARTQWQAQIEGFADWLTAGEAARRQSAQPYPPERRGTLELPSVGMVITGTADRIDMNDDGTLSVIDYKTGKSPSKKQILHFDRQLLIEAAMAEAGSFDGVPAATVRSICHIALGSNLSDAPWPLREDISSKNEDPLFLDPDATLAELIRLIGAYRSRSRGYTALRAVERMFDRYDYAHLARFGEWNVSDDAVPEDVG